MTVTTVPHLHPLDSSPRPKACKHWRFLHFDPSRGTGHIRHSKISRAWTLTAGSESAPRINHGW
jgi:hypothetical protein